MNTFWKSFWINTGMVLVILAVLLAIAWLRAAGEHFVRVAGVLYGFLLGWLAAWWNRWWSSKRHAEQ